MIEENADVVPLAVVFNEIMIDKLFAHEADIIAAYTGIFFDEFKCWRKSAGLIRIKLQEGSCPL